MIRALIIFAVVIAVGLGVSLQRSNNQKPIESAPVSEPAKPSAGSDLVWESAQSVGTIKTLPTGERIFIYTIWYQGRGLSTSAVLLPPLPVAPVEK